MFCVEVPLQIKILCNGRALIAGQTHLLALSNLDVQLILHQSLTGTLVLIHFRKEMVNRVLHVMPWIPTSDPPEMLDESSQTGLVGMSTVDHILIVHSAGRKLDLEEIWGPKNGVVSNCKDLVTFCIRGRAYWIHSLTLSITTKFI